MVDVFEEVEEQLRSDRYRALVQKVLPWVVAGLVIALAVAVGLWGWDQYRTNASAKASEQYAAALDTFNQGRSEAAFQQWGEVAKSPSKVYRSLALMQQGGVRIADGKTADAVKLFDAAAEAAPSPILGDIARLKSAFALMDTAPYKDLEARLTPLTEEGRPYRAQAREALAFSKLMAGNLAGARGDFVTLSLIFGVADTARERARAAIALIDSGAAKSIPAVAKAAAALPPPTPLAPGALPPGLMAPGAPQPQSPGPQ